MNLEELLLLLGVTLAGVFYGHFLMSRKDQRKDFNELREKFIQLDQTAIREAQVRVLIHDALQPMSETLNAVKSSLDRVESGLSKLELQRAYDKGVADSLAKGQT